MHYAAAALAFVATCLYAYRTGQVASGVTRWELVARVGIGAVLITVAAGYAQLAVQGAPFVARHYCIGAAFLVVTVGYVGLLWPHRKP